jgi:hypothetical protein
MAISAADNRRERGASPTQPSRSPATAPRAPIGPTLAITMALAVACFGITLAVVMLLSTPTELPAFHAEENQRAESTLYVLGFVVILPLALAAVPRLVDRIAAGANGSALSVLAGLLVASLGAALIVARVLPGGGGVVEELALLGAWSLGAAGVLARAREDRPWRMALAIADAAPAAWAGAGLLVLGALLAFTDLGSISPMPIVLGAIVVAGVVYLYARRDRRPVPRIGRPWGFGLDLAAIAIIALAVPDLVILGPGPPLGVYTNSIIQFHHDLWLGPVNEMLAGRVLLVDTAGQYGVAPLYLLAGWFKLAPIGYGTLGFFDVALFALLFVSGYCVLRLAGTSRLLAAATLAFAVIVLVYNLAFSVGVLPQHGPLRFGLPMALILAAIAETRWPRRAAVARAAQLIVVGLASIWALEALAYTLFTFAALTAFKAWMRPAYGRLRWLVHQAGLAIVACIAAQVLFVAVTLAASGVLPDYGWYLAFLNAFFRGNLAELTYDFTPWSAGLPVGVAYAASAAGVVLLVRRRPDLVARERVALTALCGVTAYGIALYSYFVDRSPDHVLPYVSLPVVIAAALWLSLLLRGHLISSRRGIAAGLAFALATSVLLVSVAWSSVGDRFERSALGDALPGGDSLQGSLHRLWHPPPLNPAAPAGEQLLNAYMPDQRRVLILVKPDLATEILIRSGRSNQLPFSDPLEDSFVGDRELPRFRRAVEELRPGDRVLIQRDGLRALKRLRAQPPVNVGGNVLSGSSSLTPQQQWVLQQIGKRFGVWVIARGAQGFVVVSLRRHRAGR